MQKERISVVEKGILAFVGLMVAVGFALFYLNRPMYYWYVMEDGIVEWLTVAGLIAGFAVWVSKRRLLTANPMHKAVTILIGLALFFVAGEEISWGMRIFGFHPGHFFSGPQCTGRDQHP